MKKKIICAWDTVPVIMDTRLVAIAFGVTEATIKQWVYQGRLHSTQIGRQHFFDREYIRSLVTRGR